ncbi:MAG: c-type cytochrome domain-containing protein, partial [Verrucomicrobiales bacterium]
MNPLRLLVFAISWLGVYLVANAEITAQQRKFFENKIRPVLAKECYKCHAAGAKKIGGKLLLDTTAGLKKGGESGSPLVAGKPDDSLIVHALKWLDDLEMPPDDPLPKNVVADFEKWILMGAPVPADKKKATAKAPAVEPRKYKPGELWSFQT